MRFFLWLAYFPSILRIVTRLAWGRSYRQLSARKIEGNYRHAANFSHKMPLDKKYDRLRSEFSGSNELCFELVKRIIQVRRGISEAANWLYIYGAILNCPRKVFPHITVRWTISIIDTLCDQPCPRSHRLAAAQIRNFVLGVRLGQSMALQFVADPSPLETPAHLFVGEEMWDGIIHFNYANGNTYRNLIERVHREIGQIRYLDEAWRSILKRMVQHRFYRTAFLQNDISRQYYERHVERKK